MAKSSTTKELIALIATTPRFDLLIRRSLPSICTQQLRPNVLVIVTDKNPLTRVQQKQIIRLMRPTLVVFLENTGRPGVSPTWNTGIDFIYKKWPHSYTAILDDDDEWHTNHLALCFAHALKSNFAEIILSGLTTVVDGTVATRAPINNVTVDDFLAGNPGWQGTNTFVKTAILIEAGKFTDGLASTNDRDLAIRLLCLNGIRIAYTRTFTATWYCGERAESLSAKGSPQKLEGLAYFYTMHNHLMSSQIRQRFFERASDLFQFEQLDIIQKSKTYLTHQKNKIPHE